MLYQVSRITRSCHGLERGGILEESLHTMTQKDLTDPIPYRIVREHVSNIIQ